jgi:peptide methionine sulfoxide reductase msrA/msrB
MHPNFDLQHSLQRNCLDQQRLWPCLISPNAFPIILKGRGSDIGMRENSNLREKLKFNDLTEMESAIIDGKHTEKPFAGKYDQFNREGTYICKKCGAALYYSFAKFKSGCGWPSFDDEIKGAVRRIPDADGIRTEIECAACGGHLGHVFAGEGFTPKNVRHCVNSVSIDFVPMHVEPGSYETAMFAGGCFWGVEYFMQKAPGVVSVVSGYTGGNISNPAYEQVCSGTTGHAEAVKIIYDPRRTNYEALLKLFLEIHDPADAGGQGPDRGEQYRSEIFYRNDYQKEVAEKCLGILRSNGLKISTAITKASEFYPAEDYHQNYYSKIGKLPYCHKYAKRFY